eukprot:COSAG01_NODE_64017_length_278_cov_0.575419_2_plen_59_part_01
MLNTPPRRDSAVIEGTGGRIMIDSLEWSADSIHVETPTGVHEHDGPWPLADLPHISHTY